MPTSPRLFMLVLTTAVGLCLGSKQCEQVVCQPWSAGATPCQRGTGKIQIQWGLDLPPNSRFSSLTYGFCANVDTVQSFVLVGSAANTTGLGSGTPSPNSTWMPSTSRVWLVGGGPSGNPMLPTMTNASNAVVYDGTIPPSDCGVGGAAIVSMLVFNVTLNNGVFSYTNNVAIGTGFAPTCDSSDVCKLDPTLKCIGDVPGMKNCAKCLSKDALSRTNPLSGSDISIFTTYYGTDSRGKTLMSGSGNPLNFAAFAMGGVYNSIASDVTDISNAAGRLTTNSNPFG